MIKASRRTVCALAGGLALTALTGGVRADSAAPVATTRHGRVRGYVDQGIKVFKGVRYGADTSARRFQPATPPQAWHGVVEATAYGHASPQKSDEADQNEDCLFLNVWTPALAYGGTRPVMVYVHGGAHANGSGSSPLYDGVALCRRGDVVVVTLNHRLNIFGYNGLGQILGGAYAASGSIGNLDLILALEWVRDNIAGFGGDPANVTVFGQSGGGGKLVTLMAMPRAAGLYHRLITMSGQHVTAMGPQHAELRMRAVLDHLGLTADRAGELATLPVGRLVEALQMADPIEEGGMYFHSVMDHDTLPRHPFVPDAPRESGHIPMIIGNTHDEARAFTAGDERNFHLTWDTVAAKLAPEIVVDMNAQYVVDWYRQRFPQMSPSDIFFAAATCGRSRPGHLIQAEERAKLNGPTWMYQLDFGSPVEPRLGAYHGFDIALAFDNCDKPGSKTGMGVEARKVAAAMSETFIAFARTGDPNNAAIPAWGRYTLPERATMIFDVDSRSENDPRADERRLFQTAPFLKQGT
ncbi:para-nitrobenzyl esterase [Brevundimonas vesicularis]|uniref:carboxylesterase/lipase family protein n=1 Tax=Brevundimonas vesicularis TaxID=41276 RepID=UPI0027889F3C|nr:carboxylesterase/lipase family protein [Brevundimonas vesicularis]MDQ1191897.1 para-nitrobenzyl esterase [Brevundimonas vesicularis]